MKRIISIIASIFFIAGTAHAQAPKIDYLQVDEAQSHLWIIGSFGNAQGTVMIEDTTLGIVSWSDTMIVCNLPDSGHGAGGAVLVSTKDGVSNRRVLSIMQLHIDTRDYAYFPNTNDYEWVNSNEWYINWRFDISVGSSTPKLIPFEGSMSSHGTYINSSPWAWSDSSISPNTSFSFFGIMDPQGERILYPTLRIVRDSQWNPVTTTDHLNRISYDSTGIIHELIDSFTNFNSAWTDYCSGSILFPPSPKNSVHSDNVLQSFINVITTSSNGANILLINSSETLGSVMALLYSIDGRLLRHENVAMNSPGEYRFDVSGLHEHVGILALTTDRGTITKKVLF